MTEKAKRLWRLTQLLKRHGRSVWLDEELIEAGDSISDAIFSRVIICPMLSRIFDSGMRLSGY